MQIPECTETTPYKEKFKHETVVCKKWSNDFCKYWCTYKRNG